MWIEVDVTCRYKTACAPETIEPQEVVETGQAAGVA
jgi:hypothetical protein